MNRELFHLFTLSLTSILLVNFSAAAQGTIIWSGPTIAFKCDHDVFKAHVAMNDAHRLVILVSFVVRVSKSARDAAGDEHREFFGQNAFLLGQLMRELFEIHAANQFHCDKTQAVRFAELVGLDDVRVNQIRDELGFADKIIHEHFLTAKIRANDFDGDTLDEIARAVLFRFIDNAHATLENLPGDFIAKFVLDGEERHARMVGNCPAMSSPALKKP